MNAKEPRYTNSGSIDLLIDHPEYGWIPFTASPDDCEEYGRELFAQAISGEFGEVAEYVEPEPTPVPVTVPQVVTMRQARLALLQSGYLDIVNTAIANMTGVEGAAAKIEWEYAQTVDIKSPLVITMTTLLSLTEEQLDDLFTLAGGL